MTCGMTHTMIDHSLRVSVGVTLYRYTGFIIMGFALFHLKTSIIPAILFRIGIHGITLETGFPTLLYFSVFDLEKTLL